MYTKMVFGIDSWRIPGTWESVSELRSKSPNRIFVGTCLSDGWKLVGLKGDKAFEGDSLPPGRFQPYNISPTPPEWSNCPQDIWDEAIQFLRDRDVEFVLDPTGTDLNLV